MKRIFTLSLLLVLVFGLSSSSKAQCSIDSSYSSWGLFPTPLPEGCVNSPYNEIVQFVFPKDTTVPGPFGPITLPFDSFKVEGFVDVPPGISFTLNAPDSMYYTVGGDFARGCGVVSGIPTDTTSYLDSVGVAIFAWATAPVIGSTTAADTIRVNLRIHAEANAGFSFVETGGIATFTDTSAGGKGDYWWWDFDDGMTSTDQNPVHSFTTTGAFNVCLVYDTICPDTFCDTVNIIIAGTPEQQITEMNVFPNPSNGAFNIKANVASAGEMRLGVYNLLGERVYFDVKHQNAGLVKEQIDLSYLPKGMYFLRFGNEGEEVVRRIIVE